jgi:putative transposase
MLVGRERKKMLSLPERRRAADYLERQYDISERRACTVLGLNRSTHRYRPREAVDAVHVQVVRLSERHDYWGYRKIHNLLRQANVAIGRDRVRVIRRHVPSTGITSGATTSFTTRRLMDVR